MTETNGSISSWLLDQAGSAGTFGGTVFQTYVEFNRTKRRHELFDSSTDGRVSIGDDLYLLASNPFDFNWLDRVASQSELEVFKRANLAIVDLRPPATRRHSSWARCHSALLAFRLLGCRFLDRCAVFSANARGGAIDTNGVDFVDYRIGPWMDFRGAETIWRGCDPICLSPEVLRSSKCMIEHLDSLGSKPRSHIRLRRSINAWISGIMQPTAPDRIHQFVRCLEGLTPNQKSTGAGALESNCEFMFSHRDELDAAGSSISLPRLLYQVRNKVEHLDSIHNVVSGRGQRVRNLAMKAEIMASDAICRVVTSPTLLNVYKDDSGVQKFFQRVDRGIVWGDPLKVQAEIQRRRRGWSA